MSGGSPYAPNGIVGVPAPGEIFESKCRIEHVLGVGGMGVVLAAHHLHLDQRVAVKLLLPEIARDQELVARFVREGRAAVRIKSEHVARVLDVATRANGEPYMIMEYLEGRDLASVLTDRGPLPIADVKVWILEACRALSEAHAKGIVHRDLKPSNLFLARREDGSEVVKVLDFGISKLAQRDDDGSARITRTRAILGTPLYMSPEQLRASRDVDQRTDIWSLGVIFYELVNGRPPFTGDTIAEIGAQVLVHGPPPMVVAVAPALEAIVRRCLAREPAERFQSIEELVDALENGGSAAAAPAIVVRPDVPGPGVTRPTTSPSSSIAIVIGLLVLALTGGGLGLVAVLHKGRAVPVIEPTANASVAAAGASPSASTSTPLTVDDRSPPVDHGASGKAATTASVVQRPRHKPVPSKPAPSHEPSSRPTPSSDRFD